MDIVRRITFDAYLQMTLIIAVLCLFYIFALIIRKKQAFYYALIPFFVFSALPILRIGIFDPYTFVDSDTVVYHSLFNMLLDRRLFRFDEEMQFIWMTYPKGYYILLLPFMLMDIPFPIISKFIGLLSALCIPLLFYYLALVIFSEKRIAYLSALFSYTLIPPLVLDQVSFLKGTPPTIGFLFYLLTLIFIFKYLKNGSFKSLLCTASSIFLIFYIHQISFYFLVIPMAVLIPFHIVKRIKEKHTLLSVKEALILILLLACLIYPWFTKYRQFYLSSYTSITDSQLLARISDAFISDKDIFKNIGIFPIAFFILFIIFRIFKRGRCYPFQDQIFFISTLMLIIALLIIKTNRLLFLIAYRYPPFIAIFFYLSGLPVVADMILDRALRNKIVLLAVIVSSLIPVGYYINWRLKWGVQPYAFHYLVEVPPKPNIMPQDGVKWFKELLAVSDYLRANTNIDTVIASPMWCGDLIRLYSKRNVTSSWKIGGFARVYKMAGEIYLRYVDNSRKLYEEPDYLYNKYKATYFIFDKFELDSKPLFLPASEVFATEHLRVVKVIE